MGIESVIRERVRLTDRHLRLLRLSNEENRSPNQMRKIIGEHFDDLQRKRASRLAGGQAGGDLFE